MSVEFESLSFFEFEDVSFEYEDGKMQEEISLIFEMI